MHVADFGAGSGAYVLLIAKALEGFGRVYAVDIQRDLLRRIGNEARKRGYTNVDIVWGDLTERSGSRLGEKNIDLVLISNVLFQVEDKAALFREARRVLRPRGRVAIIDWKESFGGMGPQRADIVTKEEALSLAKEADLELQREFPAGAHHYGLMLRLTQ